MSNLRESFWGDLNERNDGQRRAYRNGYYELKQMAQAIYLAEDRKKARAAFRCFKLRWQTEYPTMVKQLEKDLPDLLSFFSFPQHLWAVAHYQYYRALFCGGTTADATDGLLCEREKCGPNHLFHFLPL